MAAQEKTESATYKKRKDERKKGNVFQSRDITNAASILILFVMLKILMPHIYETISDNIRLFMNYVGYIDKLDINFTLKIFETIVYTILSVTAPIMVVAMVVGVVASGAQTKFIFAFEPLKFKMSRISPLQGIKKMFSMRTIVELLKSIIKAVIICFVFYNEVSKIFETAMKLMYNNLMDAIIIIFSTIFDIVLELSIVFIAIAVFDYLYQWWDHEKNIKMTKQEVKEEYKQIEGDPQVKGKIKEMQRKRAQQRMMQQVPTADVIVRNPTHFAIALKYDIDKNLAPIVVAKGQDYLAMKIIKIATENDIPMIENKPLARALYDKVELGCEIPSDYYSTIAEILAWVYSLKKKDVKLN